MRCDIGVIRSRHRFLVHGMVRISTTLASCQCKPKRLAGGLARFSFRVWLPPGLSELAFRPAASRLAGVKCLARSPPVHCRLVFSCLTPSTAHSRLCRQHQASPVARQFLSRENQGSMAPARTLSGAHLVDTVRE